MNNYLICVRNTLRKNNNLEFGDEPGKASFIVVPDVAPIFSLRPQAKTDITKLNNIIWQNTGCNNTLPNDRTI